MGFAGGGTTVYLISMAWNSDLESEVRYWRKEAIKARGQNEVSN
jgi:hypothetical protein